MGGETYTSLQEQGEVLTAAQGRINDTNEATLLSGKRLNKMARKNLYNKGLLYGVIILLLVLIGLVIYFGYINNN